EDIAGDLLSVSPALFNMDSPVALLPVSKDLGLSAQKRADLVNERVQTIKELIASKVDRVQIDNNPLAKIAYSNLRHYITAHTDSIKTAVGKKAFTQKGLTDSLSALIERLDAGITPNAEH